MLTGVAGGMSEYFDTDPVLGAVFSDGLLIIAYFIMAIIMPSSPLTAEGGDAEPGEDDGEAGTEDGESDATAGARTAVRYLSHVTRQHPDRRKQPAIHGKRVAFACQNLILIDLPGPGFVATVVYNRDLRPRTLEATFANPPGTGGPIFTSDHLGKETTLAPGRQTFALAPPRSTFQAHGETYAWVAGDTRMFRYPGTIRMETPAIPTTG